MIVAASVGRYSDYADQTSRTSELAARLLSGERAENIRVVYDSAPHATVDSRQLRRWNIPESALPLGAVVLFRQPTIWERYHKYLPVGVAVIVVQALLIAGLLWQRARGRSARIAIGKLSGRLIHAQEEERSRIARELHDDFSQRLAVQSIELEQLREKLPESEVEGRSRAGRMLKGMREMSADVRALSHRLHSSRLPLVGLAPALSGLCEEVTQKHKVAVSFREHDISATLSKDVALCLFRVAQEALNNVVRHSQATSARVELSANAKAISLLISDPGKGFTPDLNSTAEGIGLIGMRERLRIVGGSLSVRSEANRRTDVLAEIPLSAAAGEAPGATRGVEETDS